MNALDLSVVVPAYNERDRLPAALDAMATHLADRSFEIVVCDDGSTDGTGALVRRHAAGAEWLRLVESPSNRGKGHAVRTGFGQARGRRVLLCDADGATPMTELQRLEAALDRGADIAVGSRALPADDVVRRSRLHRRVMGRAFAWVISRHLVPGIADTQCGFKLFTEAAARTIARSARTNGFAFDLEVFVIARAQGLVVEEVPVSWADVAGSKVRLGRDSLAVIADARRIWWWRRRGVYDGSR